LEGFHPQHISDAEQDARNTRKSIVASYKNRQWDQVNERIEATKRVFTTIAGARRSSKLDSLLADFTSLELLNRGNMAKRKLPNRSSKDDVLCVAAEPEEQRENCSKVTSLNQDYDKLESLNRSFQISMPVAVRKQQKSAPTA
jgi:hypothetical protein